MKIRIKRKNFSLERKCFIYRKYKGICYFQTKKIKNDKGNLICKNKSPIRWNKENLCFHHIKFSSNGGNASIMNCAPAHKKCHIKYHQMKNKKDKGEKSELY